MTSQAIKAVIATKRNATTSNEFEGFAGTDIGEMQVRKWSYPAIGYQASAGQLHDFGESVDIDEFKFVPLAIRQCHEVEGKDGLKTRYPLYTRNDAMKSGKKKTRLQVLVSYQPIGSDTSELYIFGAKSWTARAAFMNPKDGKHRDDLFGTGLWVRLAEYIKLKTKSEKIQFTPLCFELTIKPSTKSFLVGSGETSDAYPLEMVGGKPVFVGAARVNVYANLFVDEDIPGWIKEWGTVEEIEEDDELPDHDDMPGGNVIPQTDTADDDLTF